MIAPKRPTSLRLLSTRTIRLAFAGLSCRRSDLFVFDFVCQRDRSETVCERHSDRQRRTKRLRRDVAVGESGAVS